MNPKPKLKNKLLVLALTLLAPIAAHATGVTWDSAHPINQAWALTNGNKTATSPNTGSFRGTPSPTSPSINGQFGTTAIPLNAKTYFEVTVGVVASSPCADSWAYLQSAFGIGVGEYGLIYGTGSGDTTAEGETFNPSTYTLYQYNRVVVQSQTNSGAIGNWISDPENDATGHFPSPSPIDAAPSFWHSGDVIGIAVDRVSNPNTVTFYHNGVHENGFGGTGTFNINGMANHTIYPILQSWWLKAPVATINGGATAFHEAIPSGYTALDGSAPTVPPVPTGLTAASGGNSHVQLNWNASSGATSYSVKRATVSGGPYTAIASPTTNSYNDTTAVNGTTYYYVVSAVNSVGASANSSQVSATPSGGTSTLPSGWTDTDIGGPSPAGSASYASGTFTLACGGVDIWGASDSFNYAYQTLSGDGTIIARVVSISGGDAAAKGGVMIRDTLAANSSHMSEFIASGASVQTLDRTTVGGTGGDADGISGPAAPYWVKMVRSGTSFSGFYSANGTTWTPTTTLTISMGTSVDIGLGVCSHVPGTLCTVKFDNVSITANSSLPSGWTDTDIGGPSPAGSASYASGTFTLACGGIDIWGATDQFNYTYQTVSGNCTVIARVVSITGGDTNAKGGVMIRNTLAANSSHMSEFIASVGAVQSLDRPTDGGTGGDADGITVPAGSYWVKMVRSGTSFSGFYSPDGTTWTPTTTLTISMGTSVDIGIGVCSHVNGTSTTVKFDNVSITTP